MGHYGEAVRTNSERSMSHSHTQDEPDFQKRPPSHGARNGGRRWAVGSQLFLTS